MLETPKSEILPDARPHNWVDRFAPESLRPWLKLGRFDRPTGIWLLMLPGWQGVALAASMAGRWPDLLLLAKIFAGAQRDSFRLGKAARRVGSARKLALLTSTKSPARISFAAPSQPGYGGYRGCGLDQWLALVSDAKFAGFARSGDSRRFSTTSRNAAGQEPASTFSRAR
jgi:hypothetical protein